MLPIQHQDELSSAVSEIENTQKLCQLLMKTSHYAKMGPEGVFAIVAKAKSLNINPLEALNGGLYYVQGKVGMSSEMMASLIRQRGHSIIKDNKSSDRICILHGRRADNNDTWTVSFSMDDAKRAGLAKNMYDKYPSIMLYNRAMAILARQLFPDVIKGAGYTMDELREIAEPKPQVPQLEEKITEEMAAELEVILSECTEEYQTQVREFMKRAPINASDLRDLPLKFYDRLKTAAIGKREERYAELDVAEQEKQAAEG